MDVLFQHSEGSSSPSTHDHKYDVYISYRGLDTRHGFTDHLHRALVNANVRTFLDDEEIETGLSLNPELESAIKASRASIIVLSENYASSTWCLDELVFILHQKRTSSHIAIPIFYHVEPTDVRKQQSSFRIAMAKHKQRMEAETNMEVKSQLAEKMNRWKKALVEVANLKGKDAKDRQETDFIEEIVTDIYHRLGAPLRSGLPFLCGMEMSIQFITSWLKDGSTHTADILTIFGLGGIGKTSLARYVHELHCRLFDRSSFIEGVNEKCTQQVNGLLDLQKQLLSDISKSSPVQVIHDVYRYNHLIENALARQKVLLVLDDIGSLEQLNALLGNKGFHPGSKIIITTKYLSLIEKYAPIHSIVQPKHTKHQLVGLGQRGSLQLLSYHAFKDKNPMKGYEQVSEKLVVYCQGHPLALKVLGEHLHKKDVLEWEECIERIKKEPNFHVQNTLEISFDSISSANDKELFKDIACFFVGKDRKYTETILSACGISTVDGITNLIDNCLLTIGPSNELKMHQLVQDMGRDVVRQESPNKPWKRSRLWCHEESFKVLKQKKGRGNLQGLVLDMRMLEKDKLDELETDALSKMDNLMLLQLNYVQLTGSYKNFPEELRWLCMHGSPLKFIPSDFPVVNLVALDMSYSSLESFDMSCGIPKQPWTWKSVIKPGTWKSVREPGTRKSLGSLKILNLSFCKQLRSIGGFLSVPGLERLILANCVGLIEVCESIEHCDELVHIDLSYCNMLEKLPMIVTKLKKVKTLVLDGHNLGDFPIKMRDMDLLEMPPKANNNGIDSQTSSSVITEALPRYFSSFSTCLPSSLVCLSLKSSKLSDASFPSDFNWLRTLKTLNLDDNPIVSLPDCVTSLHKLEILSMRKCKILKIVMHPPRTLRQLIFCSCDWLRKIKFHQDMSPLELKLPLCSLAHLSIEIEGMVEVQALAHVAEEVLCSLGWNNNLEFSEKRQVKTSPLMIEPQKSLVQVYYEFGIFSTIYSGMKIPNWIRDRRDGPSISFTIPSSPNNLRGLNFCYVLTFQVQHKMVFLPMIIIRNRTKSCTWIYRHYIDKVKSDGKCLTLLSHWIFGKNEMEDGDEVTVTVTEQPGEHYIRECGVSLVYDDNEMIEEDGLGYYKSWNHIIGGDLSPFQTTKGEYILHIMQFFLPKNEIDSFYLPYVGDEACYKVADEAWFRAFSRKKIQDNKKNTKRGRESIFCGPREKRKKES